MPPAAALLVVAAPLLMAQGHGSLTIPQTRNAIDRLADPWKGGYPLIPDFPGTGRWGNPKNETCGTVPWSCQEGCTCSNGTEACDVGQSCFWFSSGCTIGCDKCDGNGRRNGVSCRCDKCANATLNKPEYRTGNRAAVAGSKEDWTRYNPWRAPGTAPIFDSCGMAGGGPVAGVESGEYNTTKYAKQGDLGSNLPYTPTGVVWKRGGIGTTAWYIRANHGGGYSYRLCPLGQTLDEKCFNKIPLDFAGPQMLKYKDGTVEEINGTIVTEGTFPPGSQWAMNPLPDAPTTDFPPPCKAGTSPRVRAPMADGLYGYNPGPCAGNWPIEVNIMDNLRIPTDILPGKYVLGFRWDCELTAQVWNACSDITIE